MVSIMARPTKSVREMVPAASGWRAIASIAAATERPSASAGPIEPTETAITAPMMLMSFGSMKPPLALLDAADSSADEDGCEHSEDVGLDDANQDLEDHERDRHEEAGERHHESDDKLSTHHVAEEADHERKGARHFRDDVERQHDELRFGEAREVAAEAPR